MAKHTLKGFQIKKLQDILNKLAKSYDKCDIHFNTEEYAVEFLPVINTNKQIEQEEQLPKKENKKDHLDLDDLAEMG